MTSDPRTDDSRVADENIDDRPALRSPAEEHPPVTGEAVLTDRGRQIYDAAMRLQGPWVNGISAGIAVQDIETVDRVLTTLRKNLAGIERPRERA